MIAPTHRIKHRKNGNIQRCIDLHATGKTFAEIGTELGIPTRTARQYFRDYAESDGRSNADSGPHCRCGLRLFGDEEIPGKCNRCLPSNAAEFLGRRGESVPVALVGRFHG